MEIKSWAFSFKGFLLIGQIEDFSNKDKVLEGYCTLNK